MSIAIIGAGVSGLHLGLLLREHDVDVTIYAERSAKDVGGGRLLNTVAHHHHTLERERALGVHHWDAGEYGYVCHHHSVLGTPQPLRFRGDFEHRSSIIDYRLYLPRLMGDFEERGGELRVGAETAADVEALSREHDLVVVAAGRGYQGELFARRSEKSPYEVPQRRISAGIYHGITYSEPKGVGVHLSLGHGELLELPIFFRDGFATALLFEAIPGGDLEVLADISYEEDPASFERTVLEKIESHFPMLRERVDAGSFALAGPGDILQGALTPVVREDWVRLHSGRYAIALGDVHCLVDPVNGQGANSGSYSAWKLGEAILADYAFDERFCRRVAREREAFVLGASDWTNMILNPQPHVVELIGAMSQNKALCDAYTQNFNHPDRQWDALASPERTAAFIARHAG
ncbi:MAG TPA: styrene monooxygenase/indole monooxygenase family protein [Solirubrobacteraceae bacterium]|nr:styrene monooxygenase/indole monooxygenase family protein [Solirubrobacteraceae bacterium]